MTAPLTRRLRRGTAATALAAASLLAVAACGSSSGGSSPAKSTAKLAPKDAVKAGVEGLQGAKSLTYTFKADVTAAQIKAASIADGDAADDPSDAIAEQILPGGSIVLAETAAGSSFKGQTSLTSLFDGAFSLDVNAGNKAGLVQFVYLDKQIYARADVSTLSSYSGASARAEIQQFASSGIATKFPFLGKAIDGDWIKIDGGQVANFIKTAEPNAIPSANPSQALAFEGDLSALFAKDVTVTRAAADPALGDHLVVTGNIRTLGTDFIAAFKSQVAAIPGGSAALGRFDSAQLPDQDVTIDTYVKDGAIDAVKFDLTQLPGFTAKDKAALGGKPLDLEVDISRTASISAPASSTAVSTSQLVQLFEGLGGSGASGL